jgi:hypothetical protein
VKSLAEEMGNSSCRGRDLRGSDFASEPLGMLMISAVAASMRSMSRGAIEWMQTAVKASKSAVPIIFEIGA